MISYALAQNGPRSSERSPLRVETSLALERDEDTNPPSEQRQRRNAGLTNPYTLFPTRRYVEKNYVEKKNVFLSTIIY